MKSNPVLTRLPDLRIEQLDRLELLGRESGSFRLDPALAEAIEAAHQALTPMEVMQVYAEVEQAVKRLPAPGWWRRIGQATITAAALASQAWARIDDQTHAELMSRWTAVMGNREAVVARNLRESDFGIRQRMAASLASW